MQTSAAIDAPKPKAAAAPATQQPTPPQALRRYTTSGLMEDQREIEIEHAGRIYRLRITQLNKLILTA
ncbi:Hemin uptake protein HemP [Duganella sp. CF458]|uniref:hemin uptake protein HemP n=1 Tax=Duganella sp. CF458 TaxID=1884368 RepID=UPI0008E7CC5E|nr:hemin uptake protein HemP [Duganella sp. CF458]SFG28193.1 Hemin uptake protein HemP [Duganella sp. CF458]